MHPTIFKRGVLVALLTFFQAVGPGVVAIAMLYALAVYFGAAIILAAGRGSRLDRGDAHPPPGALHGTISRSRFHPSAPR